MVCTLNHRGPDEHAVMSLGAATFGVARLRIVDRAAAHQPMTLSVAGRRSIIAYNGEVYNYPELRAALVAERTQLLTHGDTEVVLAAHLRHGHMAVESFDGMFAYAIWDETERELLLVRDRLGIKPLYYAEIGSALLFASEPKALFCHPDLARQPEHRTVLEYFLHGVAFASGYATGAHSFFAGVRALPPGHMLSRAGHRTRLRTYWTPLQEIGEQRADEQEAQEELAAAVKASVRSMLMGEVPVGTALSGGLDSSLLTAEAAQALPGELYSACITYRADHSDPDAHHAAILSTHLNRARAASHRLEYTYLTEDSYLDELDELIQAFDEPHWEPRQLAMFANYQTLARAGQTVVLTGEGADELFFGYYRKFPGFRAPAIAGPIAFADLWRRRLPLARQLLAPAFANGLVSDGQANALIDDSVAAYLTPYWEATGSRLRAVQCWYLHTFLPWLLLDNDRCSMAHSLEGRFPFLSRQLVALALRLPPEWNISEAHATQEKLLLRRAATDILPAEIWRDRAKSPLPVPLSARYHARIFERLMLEIERAHEDVWAILDKQVVLNMSRAFNTRLRSVGPDDGAALTSYLRLDAEFEVRTAHLFAVLTFLRWYELNFRHTGKEPSCLPTTSHHHARPIEKSSPTAG